MAPTQFYHRIYQDFNFTPLGLFIVNSKTSTIYARVIALPVGAAAVADANVCCVAGGCNG